MDPDSSHPVPIDAVPVARHGDILVRPVQAIATATVVASHHPNDVEDQRLLHQQRQQDHGPLLQSLSTNSVASTSSSIAQATASRGPLGGLRRPITPVAARPATAHEENLAGNSLFETERIPLSDADVAYLVGRGGQTRIRLENFSGARMQIDRDAAEVCAISRWAIDSFALCGLAFTSYARSFVTSPLFALCASPL